MFSAASPILHAQQVELNTGELAPGAGSAPHDIVIGAAGSIAYSHSADTIDGIAAIDIETGVRLSTVDSPGDLFALRRFQFLGGAIGVLTQSPANSIVSSPSFLLAIGNTVSPGSLQQSIFTGGSANLYSLADPTLPLLTTSFDLEAPAKDVAISPDLSTAVVATDGGDTFFFDMTAGTMSARIVTGSVTVQQFGAFDPGPAQSVAITNSHAAVIGSLGASGDAFVQIFDLAGPVPVSLYDSTFSANGIVGAYDLAVSPSGATLAVAVDNGDTHLFSLGSGTATYTGPILGAGRTYFMGNTTTPTSQEWYWFAADTIRLTDETVVSIGTRLVFGSFRSYVVTHDLQNTTNPDIVEVTGLAYDLDLASFGNRAVAHLGSSAVVISLNPLGSSWTFNTGPAAPLGAFNSNFTSNRARNSVSGTEAGDAIVIGQRTTSSNPARVSIIETTGVPFVRQAHPAGASVISIHEVAVDSDGLIAAVPNQSTGQTRFFNMLNGDTLDSFANPSLTTPGAARSILMTSEHAIALFHSGGIPGRFGVYDLCQNPIAIGNAGALFGDLLGEGSTSIETNDFNLRADNITLGSTALLSMSSNIHVAGIPTPWDGLLHLQAPVIRLGIMIAPSTADSVSFPIDLGSLPGAVVGQTLAFQCWYRDTTGAGTGGRFTNALDVTFRP